MLVFHYTFHIFSKGYLWARDKPQSVGYGVIIFILGLNGLPDFIIQLLGLTIFVSGLRASWDYIRKPVETGQF